MEQCHSENLKAQKISDSKNRFFDKIVFLTNKETLAQMFSCKFYEIFKNIFFYRTPLVAAFAMPLSMVLQTEHLLSISY